MFRAIRFLLFGSLIAAALRSHAQLVGRALRCLASPRSYEPDLPVVAGLAIAAAGLAYLTWLCGATLARWPMRLALHATPFALLALAASGALSPGRRTGPGDEAREALARLAAQRAPCSFDAPGLARWAGRNLPASGYRAHGLLLPFTVLKRGGAPVLEPEDPPGTIYLVCDGRRSWVTAVVHGPRNESAMLRDARGRIEVLARGDGS